MKVILSQDVDKLGRAGEEKEVAPGYARHWLFKNNLALPASPANLRQAANRRQSAASRQATQESRWRADLERLAGLTLVITAKTSSANHLFSGLRQKEIAAALRAAHQIDLPLEAIQLSAPIKTVGEFKIPLQVGADTGTLSLTVKPALGESPSN